MVGGMSLEDQDRNARVREERNRRIIAELRASARADAPIDPEKKVKRLVAELAILMALAHGGDWRTRVDLREGLVMIARRGHRRTL